jgi:hypothetical protein
MGSLISYLERTRDIRTFQREICSNKKKLNVTVSSPLRGEGQDEGEKRQSGGFTRNISRTTVATELSVTTN